MQTYETRWFLNIGDPRVALLQEHIDNSIHRSQNRSDIYFLGAGNTVSIIRNNKKLIHKTYEPYKLFSLSTGVTGESHSCTKYITVFDNEEIVGISFSIEKKRKLIALEEHGHIEFSDILIQGVHYMTLGIEVVASQGYEYFLEQVNVFFSGIDIHLNKDESCNYKEFLNSLILN